MNMDREKQFARIFTSKMHSGCNFPLDERFNGVGRLLIQLFNRVRELERKYEGL
jgi:hypothetical protein